MKPVPFDYFAPTTRAEALALLAAQGDDAKLLAGGQSLVPAMNFRLARPTCLIDLNRIADLAGIAVGDDGTVVIGAMTRQVALERSALVAARLPLLSEALPWIAHPQIRQRGTLGGSLAHADPAAELPALAVTLGARLRLQSQSGERWVAADEFFLGVMTTALDPAELLTEMALPALPAHTGTAFAEVARRHGDYALVGAAATVTLDSDAAVADCRLVFFAVGDGPVIASAATDMLRGQRPSAALIAAAARAAEAELDPASDIHATAAYRRQLAQVLARRTLARAAERARATLAA